VTSEPAPPSAEGQHLPLSRDPAFTGAVATQFLGSFNDNVFKQLVLLISIDYVDYQRDVLKISEPTDYFQPAAMALFAIPFVLFSGFAGWLSDRVSKRRIFVLAKVAEIVVMLLGMAAFFAGGNDLVRLLVLLLIVLFCMSTQSAFFGPPKYGILPELFHDDDLPRVNGAIQMTTFLSIIFGMAAAGFAKQWFQDELYMVSLICVGIAVLGTGTALMIRKTPVADPHLPFQPAVLLLTPETRKMVFHDRQMLGVLIVSSVFWFLGGVVQQGVNVLGRLDMKLGDARTSMAAACMGIGIAIGCLAAGWLSKGRVNLRITRLGAAGAAVCLIAVAIFGAFAVPRETIPSGESFLQTFVPSNAAEWTLRSILTLLGFFAGLFAVPLQVFLQVYPPDEQKGRVIGAMNLINWIGIVFSAFFYTAADRFCSALEIRFSWMFCLLAVGMAAVALFYRPGPVMHFNAASDNA
jgi:MFS family permease